MMSRLARAVGNGNGDFRSRYFYRGLFNAREIEREDRIQNPPLQVIRIASGAKRGGRRAADVNDDDDDKFWEKESVREHRALCFAVQSLSP